MKKKYQDLEIYASTLFPGLIYQIQGPNGSGKSTLLDVFAHEQRIDKGVIYYEGKSGGEKTALITYRQKTDPAIFARKGKNTKKLLWQHYCMPSRRGSFHRHWPTERRWDFWKISQLQDIANRKTKHLSSGTRRKIGLLRVFLQDARLIIIDDPGFESLG
ncbi:MAG: ATP-binding cassette domain-containing protein [Candidatus Marinimicrobia bacterium]|nr:ATP-binding cassette domain-containing protein [Candidatus Neomarinimicrobiota bacterium]